MIILFISFKPLSTRKLKRRDKKMIKAVNELKNSSFLLCAMASTPAGNGYVTTSNLASPGDSGGPLVQRYGQRAYSIGVASHTFPDGFNIAASIFTYVPMFVEWIDNVINNHTSLCNVYKDSPTGNDYVC